MLHQRYKDIVFWGIAKATVPNYFLRRYLMNAHPANGARHLHPGCGPKYLPGFLNIDGNLFNKIDVWLDVRNGLPFPSNSVDSIYSTHMFEHFYPDELKRLLQECIRVLKSGGGIRLIVPSLESAIAAYTSSAASRSTIPFHVTSIRSAAGFRILFSATDSTGPLSISVISARCCAKRDFGRWRNPRKGRAAYMEPAYRRLNQETRWICRIRCTWRRLNSCLSEEPVMLVFCPVNLKCVWIVMNDGR